MIEEAPSQRPTRAVKTNRDVALCELQRLGDLTELCAVDVDAPKDVGVRQRQIIEERHGAAANVVGLRSGDIGRLGGRDRDVLSFTQDVERRRDHDATDPSVDMIELTELIATLEDADGSTLVHLTRIERGEASTNHALEVAAKAS